MDQISLVVNKEIELFSLHVWFVMSARLMAVIFILAGFHLLPTAWHILYVTAEMGKFRLCEPKKQKNIGCSCIFLRVLLIEYDISETPSSQSCMTMRFKTRPFTQNYTRCKSIFWPNQGAAKAQGNFFVKRICSSIRSYLVFMHRICFDIRSDRSPPHPFSSPFASTVRMCGSG